MSLVQNGKALARQLQLVCEGLGGEVPAALSALPLAHHLPPAAAAAAPSSQQERGSRIRHAVRKAARDKGALRGGSGECEGLVASALLLDPAQRASVPRLADALAALAAQQVSPRADCRRERS